MCGGLWGVAACRILFIHILPTWFWDVLHLSASPAADMTLSIVSFSFIGFGHWATIASGLGAAWYRKHTTICLSGLTLYPVLMIVVCTLAFHTLGRWIERRVSLVLEVPKLICDSPERRPAF